jgi:hypothetical protein
MKKSWSICIDSWVLEDGNYPGFDVGTVSEFALEFYLQNFAHSASSMKSAELIKQGFYHVNAEIIYIDSEVWILDCGVLAYTERINSAYEAGAEQKQFETSLEIGQMITADLSISVDNSYYSNVLSTHAGAPALIYKWQVNSIEAYCAPLIRTIEGSNHWHYDEKKEHWHQVLHAGYPDDAPAYALNCVALDDSSLG